MQFSIKHFQELSTRELYRILELRSEVFVVEQDCPYLDPDGLDENAFHVLGTKDSEIQAYARIIAPGAVYQSYVAVGRVVTSSKIRKEGYGRSLVEFTLGESRNLFPEYGIKISAQSYLISFYESLGFTVEGKEYLEDGIPHIAMINKKEHINTD